MVTKKNSRNPWAWIPTLYFAEGLPNVIVTALSVVMYMQLGLTDAEVGLYTGWLALPWVIKPLWSPFIDLLKTKRWWVLTMQLLMGSALAGIAFTLPTPMWFQGSMFFLFAMAKAIVPRYRYDQLMRLGWKVFLPLSLAAVVIVAFTLQLTGWYRYGDAATGVMTRTGTAPIELVQPFVRSL